MRTREMTKPQRFRFALVLVAIAIVALLAACQAPQAFAPECAETPGEIIATASPASDVYARQELVITTMLSWYPSVKAVVIWKPCKMLNSFYRGTLQGGTIELCTEMEAYPDAALFFAAHEAGHAISHQLAGTMDEQAADEIGALAMIRMGLQTELLGAAIFHETSKPRAHYPGDPHPSNGYRAWELSCLAAGSEDGGPADCVALYQSTKQRWDNRLGDAQVPVDDDFAALLRLLK